MTIDDDHDEWMILKLLRSFVEKYMIFRLNVYDLPKYMIPSFWNFTIISLKVNVHTDSFMNYHWAETIRSLTESMQSFAFEKIPPMIYALSQDRSYPARIVYFQPGNYWISQTHDRKLSVRKPDSRSYTHHRTPPNHKFWQSRWNFRQIQPILKTFSISFYWVIIFDKFSNLSALTSAQDHLE